MTKTMTTALLMALTCVALFLVGCSGARDAREDEGQPIDTEPRPEPPPEGEPQRNDEPTPRPEPEPERCVEGDYTCSGSTLDYCYEGSWVQATCDELCALDGYTSSGCADGACSCDGFLDEGCAAGADAMCACYEWAGGGTCTQDEFLSLYAACWAGDFAIWCYSLYVEDGLVDCATATDVCL